MENRTKGKLEINIQPMLDNFKARNWNTVQRLEYIQKTRIVPVLQNGHCIFLRSAYEQAIHDNVPDLNGYMNMGCYDCDGYPERSVCKKFYTVSDIKKFEELNKKNQPSDKLCKDGTK